MIYDTYLLDEDVKLYAPNYASLLTKLVTKIKTKQFLNL